MKAHVRLFGIPVRFEISFFVIFGVFGYFAFVQSGDPHGTEKMILWLPLVTAAVLIHELGHALAAKAFGVPSFVVLHSLGGSTRMAASRHRALSGGRRLLIPLAGPAVGLVVGLAAQLAVMFGGLSAQSLEHEVLQLTVLVTAGWSLLNLIPVLPLDGGHALAAGLCWALGPRGTRYARFASIALAFAAGVVGLFYDPFWPVAAGLVAVVNYKALRFEDQLAAERDRGESQLAYTALANGDTEVATEIAQGLLERAEEPERRARGLQVLAWAHLLEGRADEAARTLEALPDDQPADAYLEGRVRLAVGDAAGAVEPLFEALADRGEEEVADALVEAVAASGRQADVLALFETDDRVTPVLSRYVTRAFDEGA